MGGHIGPGACPLGSDQISIMQCKSSAGIAANSSIYALKGNIEN